MQCGLYHNSAWLISQAHSHTGGDGAGLSDGRRRRCVACRRRNCEVEDGHVDALTGFHTHLPWSVNRATPSLGRPDSGQIAWLTADNRRPPARPVTRCSASGFHYTATTLVTLFARKRCCTIYIITQTCRPKNKKASCSRLQWRKSTQNNKKISKYQIYWEISSAGIFKFFVTNRIQFSILPVTARRTVCISVSSGQIERDFSSVGRTVTEIISRLFAN